MNCTLCPRQCGVERNIAQGFCQAGDEPEAAAICLHRGEEPPLCGERGICNVFFSHCNLHCIYCQNQDISTQPFQSRYIGVPAIVDRIEEVLKASENIVGLVSPSHYANSIPAIVEELHRRDLYPTIVYNTGGYDSVETLRALEGFVDIYLPDFKYADSALSLRYSHCADYPEKAYVALKEMYRQKGSGLPTDDHEIAFRGIIVRHLILPGQVNNSLQVLDRIADISPNLHVSLMAQYFPIHNQLPDELSRTISQKEYDIVVERLNSLGLTRGWAQDLESSNNYKPDFSNADAFELKK